MSTLSKLHEKCNKCKYKDFCANKRMMACEIAELPKSNMMSLSSRNTESLSQPLLVPHTPITINMGEYGIINTSLEEIQEQLKKDFYKDLNIGCNYECKS